MVLTEGGTGEEEWARCEKVWWRVVYDGSQKVFQLFDDAQDYKQAEKVLRVVCLHH